MKMETQAVIEGIFIGLGIAGALLTLLWSIMEVVIANHWWGY